MLIFVHGDDDYRSSAYVRDQIAKFKTARDPGGYNTRTLNAPEEDAGVVMREITAAPFLADRRMVVVKNVLSSSSTDFLEQFLTLLNQNPSALVRGKVPAAKGPGE